MEPGLEMNVKTKGNVTADCRSGVCTYAGLHEHRQQDGEGAAPLSPALLGSSACFGVHSSLPYHLQVKPALPEDKHGVGGEGTR